MDFRKGENAIVRTKRRNAGFTIAGKPAKSVNRNKRISKNCTLSLSVQFDQKVAKPRVMCHVTGLTRKKLKRPLNINLQLLYAKPRQSKIYLKPGVSRRA